MRLTTPPGNVGRGQHLGQGHRRQRRVSEAQHHGAQLPDTITGARRLTSPSRLDPSGAMTPTTPLGSGTLKLK